MEGLQQSKKAVNETWPADWIMARAICERGETSRDGEERKQEQSISKHSGISWVIRKMRGWG